MSTTGRERSAVVTGAGEGLGRALAIELAIRGYRVLGTAFVHAEIDAMAQATDGRAKLTLCDITDDDAVDRFARAVAGDLGDAGLDLLVSNVGVLIPGPVELVPLEALRRNFEIDVFGALRVIKAMMPALRRARGRIVQLSSVSSRFSLPFSSASSAAKAAIDSFADALRTELRPSGVQVTTVLPASMRTAGPGKVMALIDRAMSAMTDEEKALYGDGFAAFARTFDAGSGDGIPAHEAAAMIADIAEREPAPAHVPIGDRAEHLLDLVSRSSDEELDAARRAMLGLTDGVDRLI